MKSVVTVLALFLVIASSTQQAAGQIPVDISSDPEPATLAGSYRLDFTIPDSPASSLLGFDDSNILRPTSVREFAMSLGEAVSSANGLSLPRAFAFEFSPALLIGGKNLSLQAYQKNRELYRLRLSAAARREEGEAGPTEMAVGLRISLIDKSDLRTDEAFISQVTAIDREILNVIDSLRPGEDPANLPDSLNSRVETLKAQKTTLISTRAKKADEQWNNDAFDIALGARFAAKDSLGNDLRANDFVGWLTYAKGFGDWGQWLFGLQAGTARDTTNNTFAFTGSASSRFYIGVNQYKAFLELQAAAEEIADTFLINGGGEARLRNGMWVAFGGGTEYDFTLKQWRVVSKFSVRIGLPTL